jgi:Tfp pilus assembly protein PilF
LQRHPFYVSARVTLGRALVELGEFDEASAVLEDALRAAPENLAAIRALAEIHKRRGELPEGIEYYRSVLAVPEGREASPLHSTRQ